ncbi:hypothetical protein GTP41_03480 [Pseudoduganella sp. DS3]|uniref:Aspartyl protease n=1 Tax=Pseudoduganella guangdongensis TaxID=2692179 RepID=A0A6N9HCC4_9BURK|nr:hypothetical protein [Pseudoduganella guangdongensis]MYN01154.1 hypothetical protein [Pseudoduganella guangdongensis]
MKHTPQCRQAFDPLCGRLRQTTTILEGMFMKTDCRFTRAQQFAKPLLMTASLATGLSFAVATYAAEKGTPSSRAREIRLSGDQVTLPIVMVREFPFIEGSVSGVEGKFMLDTAAEDALSLNSHRIPIANLETVGTGVFGSGQSFTSKLAPVVKDIRIASLHYTAATRVTAQNAVQLEGITPDFLGWFGFHAWDGYTMKLDYRKLQAIFYRKTPAADYLAGERLIAELPFDVRRRPNIPVMPAKLGGVDITAAFDTGAYGYLYVGKETKEKLVALKILKQNDGEDDFAVTGLSLGGVPVPDIKSIRVATASFPASRPTGLPSENLLWIGHGFLREYKTVWDYQGKKIYLLDNR